MNYMSTTAGDVKATVIVSGGKISISVPTAVFSKYPYPTDTMMISAQLAE